MGIFATFAVSFGDVSLSGDALKREPGETPGQTRCLSVCSTVDARCDYAFLSRNSRMSN